MDLKIKKIIHEREWVHYLTRSFTFLGTSLWQEWYLSEESKKCIGLKLPNALFVEQPHNTPHYYLPKEDLARYKQTIIQLVHNPEFVHQRFQEAFELNANAKWLLEDPSRISDLSKAVEFLINVGLRCTVLPFWVFTILSESKKKDKELLHEAQELRSVSYYSPLLQEIIVPLALERLRSFGISNPQEALEVLTYQEIVAGSFPELKERVSARKSGAFFVYAVSQGKETVIFTKNVGELIAFLEPELTQQGEIKGNIAFKGKAKGIVRLIDTLNWKTKTFNKGDVLVSINSNPTYMPLIRKAGALVTDEGGLMCHAAIVARELKIPCIIGTKVATKLLRDGDLVEVDANKGVVNLLEKRS